jgi:hypothetical protein
MTEDTKCACARTLATWGALVAFLGVFGSIIIFGDWGAPGVELGFWCALFAAITCERLGTMRSTKGRWL